MPIPIKTPIPHPTQAGVFFTDYSIEEMTLRNGSAIDAPATLVVKLRPCLPVDLGKVTAYLSAPNVEMFTVEIPDVYQWASQRMDAGDPLPLQAMGALMMAAGGEYQRR